MRRFTLILTLLAVVFLAWMLHQVGWDLLLAHIRQVGWYWPLLLLPYGLVNLLGAVSWRYLLISPASRPSVSRLFWLRLAGESLNQLTPTASMGGEPFRVTRLAADGVPWQEAAASVVIQKGVMVTSLVLFICVGLALVPLVLPESAAHLGWLSLATLVLGSGGVAFVIVQRKHPCTGILRLLEKCRLCPAALKAKEAELASLDAALAGFYRDHPHRGLLAFLLFFLSWLLHAVEVAVIFWLLGHPLGWGLVVALDALAMLFAGLGFMIPVSLGVQDGGNILLALGFNLGAALGAAFSVLRRLREAFWLALGLLVAVREK